MNPKVATIFLIALAVCLAVANAERYESLEFVDRNEDDYPTKPPKEESGGDPADGGDGGKGGEEKGENGGEDKGGDNGGGAGGNGGEKPKEPPVGDDGDIDAKKHKGFCHWGIAVWFKPGFAQRCNCMRCVCQNGGNWKCDYHFAFCPYYYCGNQIFNPLTQLCCCGKVHDKKANYQCCGYYYYDKRHSKCCNYYSVKPIKSNCPRYTV